MKYYNWLYKATTLNLLASSLCLVLGIALKNWMVAIWCANAWWYTFILRAVIRDFNTAAYLEYNKPAVKGTKK